MGFFKFFFLDPRTSPICAELFGAASMFQVSKPEAQGRARSTFAPKASVPGPRARVLPA